MLRTTVLLLLAFQHATVIDVQVMSVPDVVADSPVSRVKTRFTLSLRIGDVIYSADFDAEPHLQSTDFIVGTDAEVKINHGKMTVRCRGGKKVTARIIQEQRILVHPHE